MSAICLLIPLSLMMALGFLAGFIWAVRSGQYDDTATPALRVLADEPPPAAASRLTALRARGEISEFEPSHPQNS